MKYISTFKIEDLLIGDLFEVKGVCPFVDPEVFVLNDVAKDNTGINWVSISPINDSRSIEYMKGSEFISKFVLRERK